MNEYWNKELPKRDKGKGRGERGREKEMTKLLELQLKHQNILSFHYKQK